MSIHSVEVYYKVATISFGESGLSNETTGVD